MHLFLLVTFWLCIVGAIVKAICWAIWDVSTNEKLASAIGLCCNLVYIFWVWLLIWGGWH